MPRIRWRPAKRHDNGRVPLVLARNAEALQFRFTTVDWTGADRAQWTEFLDAREVLMHGFAWDGLKRALRSREIRIESLEQMLSLASTISLQPEPVPIDVKVVIIGSRNIFDMLFRHDPDFPKIFKVLADFDNLLKKSRDHARDLLTVLRKVILEEGLLELDAGGSAAILEEAVRIGGEGSLASAGQTEKQAGFAVFTDVGRAVHGQHVFLR